MSVTTTADPFSPAGVLAPPGATRPSWSGLLQLSLVGIPLKAYPAVRTREVTPFHQLHANCGQRIRYAKQCPAHGPVDAAAIVKGYEYGPEQHLVLEPEDLDPLRPAQDRALRLERFVDPAHFDLLLLSGRSLHLLPDGPAAEHPYDVLREGMNQRQRWAIGRLVLGGHRQVVVIRPASTGLIAQVLHFPEHVRACPRQANSRTNGTAEELRLAGQLIDAASGNVDWANYRDDSAHELRALIERKLQGQMPSVETAPAVLPFLQALQQSVARTEPTPPAKATPRKAAAPKPRRRRA
jgi:DNA end-binding protein Ku